MLLVREKICGQVNSLTGLPSLRLIRMKSIVEDGKTLEPVMFF